MESGEVDELQSEAPPTKRVRVEPSDASDFHFPTALNNMDVTEQTGAGLEHGESTAQTVSPAEPLSELDSQSVSQIPGLNLMAPNAPESGVQQDVTIAPPTNVESIQTEPAVEAVVNSAEIVVEKPDETQEDESPSVTRALETLLGGITPPATQESIPINVTQEAVVGPVTNVEALSDEAITHPSEEQLIAVNNSSGDVQMIDANTENLESQEPEFEIDSSPYESSSDDSSSDDSSSEEDSDDEDAYQLLDPEEQARILMEGDGGSDDEGGGSKGTKGAGGQLRTKNEVPEEVVPKPDVTITPEMKIEELGQVEHIVENIVLIKAKTSGEYRVLESGSVLCLEDRSVIGAVSETLGRVQEPLYSVRFTNLTEVEAAGLTIGTKVFYSEQHSTYVFTQALKAFKGSDASNLHDEEIGDEEVEFSDDEAEMEHKRRIKQKRLEKRGGKQQHDRPGRGEHPLRQEYSHQDTSNGLSYDDGDDEGPYKPLTRPAGFGNPAGRREAPREEDRSTRGGAGSSPRGSHHGRGGYHGGRGRDRGDRGRGGPGRGDGYSKPPQGHNGSSQPPPDPRPNGYGPSGQTYASNSGYYTQAPSNPYPTPGTPYPQPYAQQPYAPPPPQYQQAYASASPSAGWQGPPPQAAPSPAGVYINPAFFGPSGAHPPPPPPPHAGWSPPVQQPQTAWAPSPPPPAAPSAEAQRAFNEAQEKLNILRNLTGSR